MLLAAVKGRILEPVAAPVTEEEFFALQAAGRARYDAEKEGETA